MSESPSSPPDAVVAASPTDVQELYGYEVREYAERLPEEKAATHTLMYSGMHPDLAQRRLAEERTWLSASRTIVNNQHLKSQFPDPSLTPLAVSKDLAVALMLPSELSSSSELSANSELSSAPTHPFVAAAIEKQAIEYCAYVDDLVTNSTTIPQLELIKLDLLMLMKEFGEPYATRCRPVLKRAVEAHLRIDQQVFKQVEIKEAEAIVSAAAASSSLSLHGDSEDQSAALAALLPSPPTSSPSSSSSSSALVNALERRKVPKIQFFAGHTCKFPSPVEAPNAPTAIYSIWSAVTPLQVPMRHNLGRCKWRRRSANLECLASPDGAGRPVVALQGNKLLMAYQQQRGTTLISLIDVREWKTEYTLEVTVFAGDNASADAPQEHKVALPPRSCYLPRLATDKLPVEQQPLQTKGIVVFDNDILLLDFTNVLPVKDNGHHTKGDKQQYLGARIGKSYDRMTVSTPISTAIWDDGVLIVGTVAGEILQFLTRSAATMCNEGMMYHPLPMIVPIKQLLKEGFDIYAMTITDIIHVYTPNIDLTLRHDPELMFTPVMSNGNMMFNHLPFGFSVCGTLVVSLNIGGKCFCLF